jgi:hypothetical protein
VTAAVAGPGEVPYDVAIRVEQAHARYDDACTTMLTNAADIGHALGDIQRSWLEPWRCGRAGAIPPHFWAGLQLIGRADPGRPLSRS